MQKKNTHRPCLFALAHRSNVPGQALAPTQIYTAGLLKIHVSSSRPLGLNNTVPFQTWKHHSTLRWTRSA
jgi:hypothetical protein